MTTASRACRSGRPAGSAICRRFCRGGGNTAAGDHPLVPGVRAGGRWDGREGCSGDSGVYEASVTRNDLPLTVIGNLVEDPELRFTAAGVAVARFTVASTPRTFDRDANTWRDEEPTFMDCSCSRRTWPGPCQRGARVVVAGRLRTDRWENPEGEKRSRMVLDVDDVGASMTFATETITRTTRPVPPRETAPDDPWASASPIRPAAPAAGPDGTPGEEPPF
ncbi:single-stranded DNA-binding protein [Streptomyces sp. NPDC090080]|uniref:single-stranded DNA-binding protein n=1 Tax=Streptomyces sp. NPDC090080 TaxID=3365939 RepID=UPI00382C6265